MSFHMIEEGKSRTKKQNEFEIMLYNHGQREFSLDSIINKLITSSQVKTKKWLGYGHGG